MNDKKLPETDSIAELAYFWDTHDLTDFDEELEEVTELVFEREVSTILIQLQPVEAKAINHIAESQGRSPSDLVRGWVLEKIRVS